MYLTMKAVKGHVKGVVGHYHRGCSRLCPTMKAVKGHAKGVVGHYHRGCSRLCPTMKAVKSHVKGVVGALQSVKIALPQRLFKVVPHYEGC